jgi:hypothetical protein
LDSRFFRLLAFENIIRYGAIRLQFTVSHMSFENWINDVKEALASVNMPLEAWQKTFHFDFRLEFERGTTPTQAAEKANRFWWRQQNEDIGQQCRKRFDCWLPNGHQGACEPVKPVRG